VGEVDDEGDRRKEEGELDGDMAMYGESCQRIDVKAIRCVSAY
jgi:hypothetical protein